MVVSELSLIPDWLRFEFRAWRLSVACLTSSPAPNSRTGPMRPLGAPQPAGLQGIREAGRMATVPGWEGPVYKRARPRCGIRAADDRGHGTAANSRTGRETRP